MIYKVLLTTELEIDAENVAQAFKLMDKVSVIHPSAGLFASHTRSQSPDVSDQDRRRELHAASQALAVQSPCADLFKRRS